MKGKITMAAGHYHFFHRIAPLMAESKGYFKEEGIEDVEILATGEDELTIEWLKEGKIDFTQDVKPLLVIAENNKGAGVYIIGGMINGMLCNLHGAKGITRIEDLKGKRVGIVMGEGSREALWVKYLLRRHGFDLEKDVTFVYHTGYLSAKSDASFGPWRLSGCDYVCGQY